MTNLILIGVGVSIGYVLILWAVNKIKRRMNAKKRFKENNYVLDFM